MKLKNIRTERRCRYQIHDDVDKVIGSNKFWDPLLKKVYGSCWSPVYQQIHDQIKQRLYNQVNENIKHQLRG
jgi:methionine salvage enolase-phosphatase E1